MTSLKIQSEKWQKKWSASVSHVDYQAWFQHCKIERDEAKKKYTIFKSRYCKERWRNSNTKLNQSYKADEFAARSKQMVELRLADETGNTIPPGK
jgi:hypothetical protein